MSAVSSNTAASRPLASEPAADSKSQGLLDKDVRIVASSSGLDLSLPAASHIPMHSEVTLVTTSRSAQPHHNVYTWVDPNTGKTGTFTLPGESCLIQ